MEDDDDDESIHSNSWAEEIEDEEARMKKPMLGLKFLRRIEKPNGE